MKFEAGKSGNRSGRPPGIANRATREFKDTVRKLLEDNAENVSRWLTIVAEGDGTENGKAEPAKALDLISKLAEYAFPKLSRAEVTGRDGKDLFAESSDADLNQRILALMAANEKTK